MRPAVFIAPHLDDAALSCGGGIARLAAAGIPVTVVTAYTAEPPAGAELSELAQRMMATWATGGNPMAERRAEDTIALQGLGADLEHLGLLGATYRTGPDGAPLYTALHGPIAPYDVETFLPELISALRTSKAGTADARVFCPVGAGRHLDHIRTRLACERAFAPESLVYYADFPYSSRPTPEADPPPDGFESHDLLLSERELASRITAIGTYKTQLGLFATRLDRYLGLIAERVPVIGHQLKVPPDTWGRRRNAAREVRGYVEKMGGERYWWWREAESPFPAAPLGYGAR